MRHNKRKLYLIHISHMFKVIKNSQRGNADHGWLQANYSFSFGQYHNPDAMGFGPLVVINEDRIAPAKGFGTHPHRNMEIITYVLSGALEHKDSMGNGSVIRRGDVQRMSAGTGITHSEFNYSATEQVHLLQIWIEPNINNIAPSYEEKHFDNASKANQLRLIASPNGSNDSVLIHQDAYLYASMLNGTDTISHTLAQGRSAYIHIVEGQVSINNQDLNTGDAIKLNQVNDITFSQARNVEILLFDLPYGG